MAIKPSKKLPSFLTTTMEGVRPVEMTGADVAQSNIESTSSFIYDPLGSPLKSSQQLNVDWSQFENHTFFMSAEAKVNLAFEQVINHYPFDGTQADVEAFFERLPGFDNWVYEQFPKFRGQLHFSGTQVGEDTDGTAGTFIVTKDSSGGLYPEISHNAEGRSVLNPRDGDSFSVEVQLYLPSVANDLQVVFQKHDTSTNNGFTMYLEPTASLSQCQAKFVVLSGTYTMETNAVLNKGRFNHVCVQLDRNVTPHSAKFYLATNLQQSSSLGVNIDNMSIDDTDFTIATGSAFTVTGTLVTPTQTFSGTMDELRVFHSTRSSVQQKQYANKSIFTTDALKLYYRFNEPDPPLVPDSTDTVNSIVLDSSGNGLHATITNFFSFVDTDPSGNITGSWLRQDASVDTLNPLSYEKPSTTPILFPANSLVSALNVDLLNSASLYDNANPNLITRLVPEHYIRDGANFEGYNEALGTVGDPYTSDGIPGEGKMGSTQMMLTFLYVFARFFDDLKLFVDAFRNLKHVDYDSSDTIPDNFIHALARQFGFDLPPLFTDSTIDQYVFGNNVEQEISTSETTLKYVQNQIMRRLLINMLDIIKSKGTLHSIKAFFRTIGIDPDNSMRIREYGGPTTKQLNFARENKREPAMMAKFGTGSLAISPYLSASYVETGWPYPQSTQVQKNLYPPHGISPADADGFLTSGSWTIEGIYKYPRQVTTGSGFMATQSLCRLAVTGSTFSAGEGIIANLIGISGSGLTLYLATDPSGTAPPLKLHLDGDVLFDGDRWNVSFGRRRNDDPTVDDQVNYETVSGFSSSYFLRAAKQEEGRIVEYHATSSGYYGMSFPGGDSQSALSATYNVSGAYLMIGSSSINTAPSLYLNDASIEPDEQARATSFTGYVSNLRFWSKYLTTVEWKEHVRNYKSAGVQDPLSNYNFVTSATGSRNRLRMNTMTTQDERWAEGTGSVGWPIGNFLFIDHSQNGFHLTGSAFPIVEEVMKGEFFDYSYLSPYFDEAVGVDKIRIRGYDDPLLLDEYPWATIAPAYEIRKSEQPTDDVRFVIEFSLVDALNRDIVTIFSTLDSLDNVLGSPELLFSPDYPDLERLRDVYFNRITEKLNFKLFFEFFRWFDTTIGTFIEQLIPRKTNFKGTNFTIEQHMLERNKLQYFHNEMYLHENDRNRFRDQLLLQQIVGTLRKY
jgi:hypothetical protein